MNKYFILFFLVLNGFLTSAQYYNAANGIAGGTPLKLALHNIIIGQASVGYTGLWNAFTSTDTKPNGKVWDIYSYKFSGAQPYEFTHFSDQCGTYSNEGDCYNREHSWPQSYFNSAEPMQTDLFHVYPTDGEVNGIRGNLPYGKVISANKVTANGSKRGTSNTYPNGSDVFEPIDSFKGDLARSYFYMNTRYTTQGNSWANWEMANGPELTPAAIALLLSWHHLDPVSTKEINRNNAIYIKQGNRNPFIDQPLYADCIWGTANCSPLGVKEVDAALAISIYPNPSAQVITVALPFDYKQQILGYTILDIYGKSVLQGNTLPKEISISTLTAGMYFIKIQTDSGIVVKQFCKL